MIILYDCDPLHEKIKHNVPDINLRYKPLNSLRVSFSFLACIIELVSISRDGSGTPTLFNIKCQNFLSIVLGFSNSIQVSVNFKVSTKLRQNWHHGRSSFKLRISL